MKNEEPLIKLSMKKSVAGYEQDGMIVIADPVSTEIRGSGTDILCMVANLAHNLKEIDVPLQLIINSVKAGYENDIEEHGESAS